MLTETTRYLAIVEDRLRALPYEPTDEDLEGRDLAIWLCEQLRQLQAEVERLKGVIAAATQTPPITIQDETDLPSALKERDHTIYLLKYERTVEQERADCYQAKNVALTAEVAALKQDAALGQALASVPVGVAVAIIPNTDRAGQSWYTVMWFDNADDIAEYNLHVECTLFGHWYPHELARALTDAPTFGDLAEDEPTP